MAMTKTNRYR